MKTEAKTIIHCGAGRITLAVFTFSTVDGLTLHDLASVPLEGDTASDAGWLSAVGAGLSTLLEGRKTRGSADWILPGSHVLSKTLKIPSVDPAKRRQVVAFEAQQSLPYPMNEITWDTQVIVDDGIETEVLFFAAKQELVQSFWRTVEASGLQPGSITPAPVLDVNALRYARGEGETVSILVNIGARSTNLTFLYPGGFTVRSVNLGGNLITQSLADNLGLSFERAEALKRRFFEDRAAFSGDDPRAEMIEAQAEQFLARVNTEITRSAIHVKRHRSGGAPSQIYLAGAGSLLPGAARAIAARQKTPVAALDLISVLGFGPRLEPSDLESAGTQLTEVVGAALRQVLPGAAGVDLLPEQVRTEHAFSKRKPWLIGAAALFAAASILPFLHYHQVADAYASRIRAMQRGEPPIRALMAELDDRMADIERMAEAIDRVDDLIHAKSNWPRFFEELQTSLHDVRDVWLDSLAVFRTTVMVDPPAPEEPQYDTDGELIVPEKVEQTHYRLNLTGNLLLRQSTEAGERPVGETYDEAIITQRIRQMTRQFSESEFIIEAGPPTIYWTRLSDGVLPFSFNLTVDPARPL